MKMGNSLSVAVSILFFTLGCYSQTETLKGTVRDAKTNSPLEMVAVYFDNTTIGTTTNSQGEFEIEYANAMQSTLVISYLGYEKVYISNYRQEKDITINLIEANNELDEVYIAYDDGLTRQQKLRLFKQFFLGTTRFGRSCKILNEEDIYLRYDNNDKTLSASSKEPIKIYNKGLGYNVNYDLNDFELEFRYIDAKAKKFTYNSAYYLGTVLFKDLNIEKPKKRIIKRREEVFKGSVQHFMRSLFNEDLASQKYTIFKQGFKVKQSDVFKITAFDKINKKRVILDGRISILFDERTQSDMFLDEDLESFTVDAHGHYTPILGIYFTGYMNQLRVGDMLPLDYGLTNN